MQREPLRAREPPAADDEQIVDGLLDRRVLGESQSQARTQPKNLSYNFVPYDDIVNRAADRGIGVEFTLTGQAPRWATGNKRVGHYKVKGSKFGAFARAFAAHYRGRTVRYSIWNEPNISAWLLPLKRAPKIYRSMYASAYRNIKAVDVVSVGLRGENLDEWRAHVRISFLLERVSE